MVRSWRSLGDSKSYIEYTVRWDIERWGLNRVIFGESMNFFFCVTQRETLSRIVEHTCSIHVYIMHG